MRRLRRHVWLAPAAALAACSGTSAPEAGLPAPLGAYGRVHVQVTRATDHADVLVSARFVGYRGVDRTTVDLLTGGDAAIAMGCGPAPAPTPYEDLVALIPDAQQGGVEHLDAGELTAIVDGVAMVSGATARPALSPYVGGMEYDDQAATVALPRGEVLVTAAGGARVGAFEAGAAVPPPVDAHATWDRDLTVAWSPAGADEVRVTIAPERGASAILCRAPDRGEVVVRGDLLARTAGVAAGAPVTVVIDRVRRAGFAAPGLADGALEVVARDVVTASAP